MPEYRIEVAPAAARQIRKLPRDVRSRVAARIDGLRSNPRGPGVEKLAGGEELYRVRVGDYRIVFAIEDDRLLVIVVKVADRKDVYR